VNGKLLVLVAPSGIVLTQQFQSLAIGFYAISIGSSLQALDFSLISASQRYFPYARTTFN